MAISQTHIKIYKLRCWDAPSGGNTGECYSLSPWANAAGYLGNDNGGALYNIPTGVGIFQARWATSPSVGPFNPQQNIELREVDVDLCPVGVSPLSIEQSKKGPYLSNATPSSNPTREWDLNSLKDDKALLRELFDS